MAKKMERSDEFDALGDVEGIDTAKLLDQAGINQDPPPADPPPADPPPADPPPADPPTGRKTDPPPTDPPSGGPPAGDPPPSDPDLLQAATLKEIFGEQFQTMDEIRNANIPSKLQELEALRQEKKDLEVRLETKPKTSFVNDNVALFNEFVKETGIDNYGVFSKLNASDTANMDPMDALVIDHVIKHPGLAGQEDVIKRNFERKYNVDPDQVEADELELNKISLISDGDGAKANLTALKEKLVVPEPSEGAPPEGPKELSEEQKQSLQTGWGQIADRIGKELGSLNIPMKGLDQSLISYELGDELRTTAVQNAVKYCVENRMEFNEANVTDVAGMMYNQLMIQELPNIVHSVFEKARSLTTDQVSKMYENPSPSRNNDQPPVPPAGTQSDADKLGEEIFDAEMGRV